MPYVSNGTLTTDTREIAISETWDTQSDWTAYQSATGIAVNNGVVMLEQSSVPSSTLVQYESVALNATDGETISTWPDSQGSTDVTGTASPGYQTNSTPNGEPAVYADGDDSLTASAPTTPQPFTMVAVASFTDFSSFRVAIGSNQAGPVTGCTDDERNRQFYIGDTASSNAYISGGSVTSGQYYVITALLDGSNTVLRANGTQVASGNPGSNGFDGVSLFMGPSGGGHYGGLAEALVYSDRLSQTEYQSEEQRLADKYGITL